MSDPIRRHLRAVRQADAVAIDAEGQIVPGGGGLFDEDAATATTESAGIVSIAHERAEHLVREAAIEAASIRHEAYAEGRAAGERDGLTVALAELADEMGLLQQALKESKGIRDRLLWAAEPEIVELVLQATRTVVGEHAQLDPALAVETVERALERAGSQNVVAIRIHPDRQEAVGAHLIELHGTPQPYELRADGTIAIGGCVIDTASGQIDARLDVQLDEIARLLREALPADEDFEELAA